MYWLVFFKSIPYWMMHRSYSCVQFHHWSFLQRKEPPLEYILPSSCFKCYIQFDYKLGIHNLSSLGRLNSCRIWAAVAGTVPKPWAFFSVTQATQEQERVPKHPVSPLHPLHMSRELFHYMDKLVNNAFFYSASSVLSFQCPESRLSKESPVSLSSF